MLQFSSLERAMWLSNATFQLLIQNRHQIPQEKGEWDATWAGRGSCHPSRTGSIICTIISISLLPCLRLFTLLYKRKGRDAQPATGVHSVYFYSGMGIIWEGPSFLSSIKGYLRWCTHKGRGIRTHGKQGGRLATSNITHARTYPYKRIADKRAFKNGDLSMEYTRQHALWMC